MDHLLKKYPMDQFSIRTPHEQLVGTVLRISQCIQRNVQP